MRSHEAPMAAQESFWCFSCRHWYLRQMAPQSRWIWVQLTSRWNTIKSITY